MRGARVIECQQPDQCAGAEIFFNRQRGSVDLIKSRPSDAGEPLLPGPPRRHGRAPGARGGSGRDSRARRLARALARAPPQRARRRGGVPRGPRRQRRGAEFDLARHVRRVPRPALSRAAPRGALGRRRARAAPAGHAKTGRERDGRQRIDRADVGVPVRTRRRRRGAPATRRGPARAQQIQLVRVGVREHVLARRGRPARAPPGVLSRSRVPSRETRGSRDARGNGGDAGGFSFPLPSGRRRKK